MSPTSTAPSGDGRERARPRFVSEASAAREPHANVRVASPPTSCAPRLRNAHETAQKRGKRRPGSVSVAKSPKSRSRAVELAKERAPQLDEERNEHRHGGNVRDPVEPGSRTTRHELDPEPEHAISQR